MPKITVCVNPKCDSLTTPKTAKGLCPKHYREHRLSVAPACSFSPCESPALLGGLCEAHWAQSKVGPLKKKRPTNGSPVEDRFWFYVAKTETCWNWTGRLVPSGYGRLRVDGQNIFAHRLSYEMSNGPIPDGLLTDHICHNRACVNPSHLRVATPKQNNEYRRGAQVNNHSTGVRGVYPGRKSGTWYAVLKDNYKQMHLGTFPSIEAADSAVRAERARRYTFADAAYRHHTGEDAK